LFLVVAARAGYNPTHVQVSPGLLEESGCALTTQKVEGVCKGRG
jgi:hypothetical protein